MDNEALAEERGPQAARKTGKVLTFDFIEKEAPDWEQATRFDWSGQQFQMIALNRTQLEK